MGTQLKNYKEKKIVMKISHFLLMCCSLNCTHTHVHTNAHTRKSEQRHTENRRILSHMHKHSHTHILGMYEIHSFNFKQILDIFMISFK